MTRKSTIVYRIEDTCVFGNLCPLKLKSKSNCPPSVTFSAVDSWVQSNARRIWVNFRQFFKKMSFLQQRPAAHMWCGSQKEARQMSLEERNAYKVLSNQSKFFHHILRHLSWAVFQVMCFPYIYCFKIRTAADWGIVGNAGIWTAELAILGMSWRAKVENRAWKCFLLSTVSKKAYPAQFLNLGISNMSANFKIISTIFHPGPRGMLGIPLFFYFPYLNIWWGFKFCTKG